MDKKQVVIFGFNVDVLKTYPDNYCHSIVTDAPYGLGKEPDANIVLKEWLEKGYHEIEGVGFMGNKWDAFVPQPIFWKEVFRVLKHGGYVCVFFGNRTYDWGVMAMRIAGFEIRDQMQWIYSTGFPKSQDVGKNIEKAYETENETNDWIGWSSYLKPASEPIVIARKPLEKGLTLMENVLKHGTGAINIDACRTKTNELIENHSRGKESAESKGIYGDSVEQETFQTDGQKLGRYPTNILFSHHEDCKCLGMETIKGSNSRPQDIGKGRDGAFTNGIYGAMESKVSSSYVNEGGFENIEKWECHENCAIGILDKQSSRENITGAASRFFYCTKASRSERDLGLEKLYKDKTKILNVHPTVKPVSVMLWLVKLVTPKNGICIDPFGGSGTTGIASKILDTECIIIDNVKEYCEIAEARIDEWEVEAQNTISYVKENKFQLKLEL